MATESDDFSIASNSSVRQDRMILDKMTAVMHRIVQALDDSESADAVQDQFLCLGGIPNIGFREFLQRFLDWGDVSINQLVAALIYMDRALRTGSFTKKSAIHK